MRFYKGQCDIIYNNNLTCTPNETLITITGLRKTLEIFGIKIFGKEKNVDVYIAITIDSQTALTSNLNKQT